MAVLYYCVAIAFFVLPYVGGVLPFLDHRNAKSDSRLPGNCHGCSPTYVFPAKTQNKQQPSRSYCVLCLAYRTDWKHVGLLMQIMNQILHFGGPKMRVPQHSPSFVRLSYEEKEYAIRTLREGRQTVGSQEVQHSFVSFAGSITTKCSKNTCYLTMALVRRSAAISPRPLLLTPSRLEYK
jgi:hypothetical protein